MMKTTYTKYLTDSALSFGIGYFDEDQRKGVKSYFIQRSYTVEEKGKMIPKTEIIVIPLDSEDSI
jgi:hypothetical protein